MTALALYLICVAQNAPAPDLRAAAELQTHLEQMTARRWPVTTRCDSKTTRYVYVGQTAPGYDSLQLGPEEFVLRTVGQNLMIAGGAPRGTLYGVYSFLDRLGVRWFTSEVTRVPRQPLTSLPVLNVREKPAFEYREVFFTEAFDREWAARNRTNGNSTRLDATTGGKVEYYPFVHSFYELLPPDKYFKDHPEYFSLIDGQRRVERGQLCLTNANVLRIAIERVKEWIRDHPTARIFTVSQNDWEGWCECDRCRRVEEDEGGKHSGPVLRFVNAVAAEIAKTNPDRLIDTLAYWYTEDPPAKVRPLPNVRIRLCPIGVCEAHPYMQCPRSAYFVRNLKAWHAITNQLYIWHYNTNFSHYLTPFPDFDELAADLPLYQRSGVVGLFLQGAYAPGGGGEHAELRSYVMARQLWDPKTDVNREVNEFLQGVYGPATKPLREYFDLLHQEVRMPPSGKGQHIWIFNLPRFSPQFLTRAEALFDQALRLSPDPATKRRVQRARLPIEYVRLMQAKEYRIQGDWYQPKDLDVWKAGLHQFNAKLRIFGIQSIREGRSLEDDEKAGDALRKYKVVTLRQGKWQVAVVPELGGRIIRMRSGDRELLRILNEGEGGYPNLGGQQVQVYPDYPLRAWPVDWTLKSSSQTEAVLEGKTENGTVLERKIWLEAVRVRTSVTARNGGSTPLELVLQIRADFEPGDIDSTRIQFKTASGSAVDRTLLSPGELPDGTEVRKEGNLPGGEWQLLGPRLQPVWNTFRPELTARSLLGWQAKGGPRATLGVWSPKRVLQPGETLRLESDYR